MLPIIFAAQEQIMRKLPGIVIALAFAGPAFSQTTTTPTPAPKLDLANRAGDHFMVQLGSTQWLGAPDSIDSHVGAFNRSANVYLMLDKPFKGNPQLSVAFGVGVSTSNVYFKNMLVDIGSTKPILPFVNVDTSNRYKKYKLTTAYLEVPIEFRFSSKPLDPSKSLKAALGVKVGTMLNAHTKGKGLEDKNGNSINTFTQKVITRSYFNGTRLTGTARVGYGNYSLFGAYSFTNLFKDGVAADINVLQVGLTLSGL
ncbi:MAG: hypothetical protein JWQ27_1751 [Ferruginibacter sp.]|nr:hypothetical protein [Ferruginibacter sp.]